MEHSLKFLALCESNLDSSIISPEFSVLDYLLLFRKDPSVHMHSLSVCIQEHLPLAKESCLESPDHSYKCHRLSQLNSVNYLYFLYHSLSPHDSCVLDSISDNFDKALSLHSFANIFVFDEFNAHHDR